MTDVHKVGPYVIGNTLGAGVTGKVRLAFDKNTGLQVAVKIVRKDLLEDDSMSVKILKEIAVMKVMDHPNVLHLYDYYEDLEHMFLVLEYSPNGDLYDYLSTKGILSNEEALRIFQQLIAGIDYCHKRLVSHRDLKPENILLDSDNNVKLCDFGMCALDIHNKLFTTSCGSPHYASPEVIEGDEYDGTKADIWSCGVILYALVSGKLPFDDSANDIVRVLEKVKKGEFSIPSSLHEDLQDLINKMLTVDASKRISIDEIRKHPWFTSVPLEDSTMSTIEPIIASPGEDVNSDFVKTISDLGFGDVDFVEENLKSDEASLIKTYYTILEDRQNNKREVVTKKGKSSLNRAKSEAMLPLSKMSKTIRTSSNHLTATLRNSSKDTKKSIKMEDDDDEDTMKATRSVTEQLKDSKVLKSSKDGKRASKFLPSWLNTSDAHLKREIREGGVESNKSLDEITAEVEETLESIGATYAFTKKRDKIKARITKESKTIKLSLFISQQKNTGSYILCFSRRAGDKELYAQICHNIKSLLDI